MPSQNRLKKLFGYDPRTGRLSYKVHITNRCHPGAYAGSVYQNGYVMVRFGTKAMRAHRIIWTLLHGPIPTGMQIDHINGVRTDNRLTNLRLVTPSMNSRNMRLYSSNKSGHPGVSYIPATGTWKAEITLGLFKTREEAIAVRKAAEGLYGFHPNHGRVVQ